MVFADFLVADDTARIQLRAKNSQVDVLKVGSTVTLTNARIEMYNVGPRATYTMKLVLNGVGGIIKEEESINCTDDENADMSATDWGSNVDANPLIVNNETLIEPAFTKVMDLCPSSNVVNLIVKVVSTKNVRLKKCPTQVSDCIIGDETGTVIFGAWGNRQVTIISEGSTITLRNAKVYFLDRSMRLGVFSKGRIEVVEPADFIVYEGNNQSLIEY